MPCLHHVSCWFDSSTAHLQMEFWLFTLIIDNILVIIIFSILLFWISYRIEKRALSWLVTYFFIVFNIIFLFFIKYSGIILSYFFNQILEPIVVLDPILFTYSFFYFIFNCTFLLSLPFLIYLYIISCSYIEYKYKIVIILNIFLISIYYFFIIFWLVKYDLFLSNWFSFSYMPKFSMLFDFQPDLEKLIAFFWIDFWELYLCIFLIYIYIYFGQNKNYINEYILNKYIRIAFFILFLFSLLYLFSEFNLKNDFILFCFLWFLFFIFEVITFFMYYLKQYKT